MDLTNTEKREKVLELVDDISTAMLVTIDPKGAVHSRPMAVAVREQDNILFFSKLETEKVKEIEGNPSVNVCFQKTSRFLSLAGNAKIVTDRSRLEAVWDDKWNVWFPDGPQDSSIAMLDVEPTSAEYWDYSGMKGLRFMLAWTKALLTDSGIEYEEDDDCHSKVAM